MSDTEHALSFATSADAWIARKDLPEATSQISYHSAGHCLFVTQSLDAALQHAEPFQQLGLTIVVIDNTLDSIDKQLLETGAAVFFLPQLVLTGHLGAFKATGVDASRELDLGVAVFLASGAFDLIIDCANTPTIDVPLKPFGYKFCPEFRGVEEATEELLGYVGEFDKPRYFDYDASICAHSRSQLDGCSQCIDVCSTGAIHHDGDGVLVDPYLCQGCGTCATVCPSGAMSYAYPRPASAIERTRELLADNDASTLFIYSEKHQQQVDELSLDQSVQPLLVEEVTAYGLDYWLSLLAGHVQRIIILNDCNDDEQAAMQKQQHLLHELLQSLGVDEPALHILSVEDADRWSTLPSPGRTLSTVPATTFSTHNNKRQTIRMALDALFSHLMPLLPAPLDVTPLSVGSPFGRLDVNTSACTLCMACVSTCPAQALQDGQDTPALKLIESNCVQCGLCAQACPESAITLEPQYRWDSVAARQAETLNETEPFHCITCHKAFATQGVITAMATRLSEHWMFQDQTALRRLKMCGDCRVKDIFREDAAGIATHKDDA